MRHSSENKAIKIPPLYCIISSATIPFVVGRPRSKIIPKEVLQKEYWENDLTIGQIAKLYHMSPDTVNRLIAEYGIKVWGTGCKTDSKYNKARIAKTSPFVIKTINQP
jgi:hypothetical protein